MNFLALQTRVEQELARPDGRRIAACLAACAGIPTDVLERVTPGTLIVATLVEREEVRR